MRLLFVIPHVFAGGDGANGSLGASPRPRVAALTACIGALHQTFGTRQYALDYTGHRAVPVAGEDESAVDVVVCTARGRHLLDRLALPPEAYVHVPLDVDPLLLGFECRDVLREALGRYDYYCYLEDDLVLRDPWFFAKLAWFTAEAGEDALLQPNRYECDLRAGGRKAYVDGDVPGFVTARHQDVHDRPTVEATVLGRDVVFRRALNPHAGCYFLGAEQMERWARRPDFSERDTSFVGPLESAATLGIMRTFRIYKPAPEHASFLEIEHAGEGYLALLDGRRREGAVLGLDSSRLRRVRSALDIAPPPPEPAAPAS